MEALSRRNLLLIIIFILFFKILATNMCMAQKKVIPVRIGIVVDMDIDVGQMSFKCISMALSDFYAANGHYKTRVVLYSRDSKTTVVGAAAAALDLLKNVEVEAIIGPLSSMQTNFLIALGDEAQVPIITFSASSPSLSSVRSPYFFRATLNDSSQVQAISAIIQAFGWREVVPIYVDNEFGEGIIPSLVDALESLNAHIPYRSVIPSKATDDQIVAELYKLMTMQTRVFVVHMLTDLGSRLFSKAKQLGMMSDGYVWIITDGMAYELDSIDPSVMGLMLGVLGVRPHTPQTDELDNFRIRYKKRLPQNNSTAIDSGLNMFGLWAYDSAKAIAIAVEKIIQENATFVSTNISRKSTDLDVFPVFTAGPNLVEALSRTNFTGLSGNFQLVDGQLQSPPYEIVNLVGPGARVVGYWTQDNGLVRELNFTNTTSYSISKSSFGSIIWPGDKMSPPKGWVVPTNGKVLKIGVPMKDGFTEFLRVTWNADNSTEVEGFCIDVFDAVMANLPYGVPYEYIPFAKPDHHSAGSYNDLAYQVFLGNFDAVAGDVTIVANRSQYIDFTLPYTESGVSMVVPIEDDKSKNAWVFLRPLTWELWLTSFCSFVFIGTLIWILEHRINEDFRGPPWHQVGMIFWFAFSTMVFAHKERVISNLSRFVLIIWFLVVLILTQSYTASLTSMLTVQQLQPTITDVNELLKSNAYVGYQKGSFVYGLLISMNFDESRLLTYNSPEEMDELFSKGSGRGGIAAAFDETPYIKLFLNKYCSRYTMVGPTYKADGFGFVFPIGSPLVPDVSRSILNVTESEKMTKIETKWFGDQTTCPDSSTSFSSNSLGLESFWGLFLIVGIAMVAAFTIYMIKFLHNNWGVIQRSDPDATVYSKIVELYRRFNHRDLSSHTFKGIEIREIENNACCGCDCMKRSALQSPAVNCLQSPSTFSMISPTTASYPSPDHFQTATDHQVSPRPNSQSEGVTEPPQEIELVDSKQNKERLAG
ncbi:glutamate receptor 2.5-like [Henckelia pumila]|uniref:glutamate receptor 2.5-like n=1 Tax=Henckelia pumila TaxID=405737 RepID=UPI003C6E6662